MKKCPLCAEDIQDAAIKCRYCGSDLSQAAGAAQSATTAAPPLRRFQHLTESDARLLPDGSTVELEPGGRLTPRVEEMLAARQITVIRLLAPSSAVDSGKRTPAPAAGSSTDSVWTRSFDSRKPLAIGAIILGFILSIASPGPAGGFGVLLLWIGIACATSGSAIVRWAEDSSPR